VPLLSYRLFGCFLGRGGGPSASIFRVAICSVHFYHCTSLHSVISEISRNYSVGRYDARSQQPVNFCKKGDICCKRDRESTSREKKEPVAHTIHRGLYGCNSARDSLPAPYHPKITILLLLPRYDPIFPFHSPLTGRDIFLPFHSTIYSITPSPFLSTVPPVLDTNK